MTIVVYRHKFDETQFTSEPLAFGQWQKMDKPRAWECPVVFSLLDLIKVAAEPVFPIP
jgi:hypothetical protein